VAEAGIFRPFTHDYGFDIIGKTFNIWSHMIESGLSKLEYVHNKSATFSSFFVTFFGSANHWLEFVPIVNQFVLFSVKSAID
jgi:hypothetical protein